MLTPLQLLVVEVEALTMLHQIVTGLGVGLEEEEQVPRELEVLAIHHQLVRHKEATVAMAAPFQITEEVVAAEQPQQ